MTRKQAGRKPIKMKRNEKMTLNSFIKKFEDRESSLKKKEDLVESFVQSQSEVFDLNELLNFIKKTDEEISLLLFAPIFKKYADQVNEDTFSFLKP